MDVIVAGGHWPEALDQLLRDLPEWFGVEASIVQYVEDSRSNPNTAAFHNGEIVGVCVVQHHTEVAAEIEVLAVRRELHRHGIGRQLVEAVEVELRGAGVKLLQVKTLGPSGSSEDYARTRAFYESVGFLPLEERTDIWGPENPCLICVKPLVP
jgi:ribosomal protein S18 acetylase RimI-like enzyme